MDKLYIIMPAYNEAANIENTVKDWHKVVEKNNGNGESRLVVIDDGSKDDTYSILKKLTKKMPLLCPLTKENGGHGHTVLYGYRYAIHNHADYIFQTDSDGQTNTEEFEAFWNHRKTFDAVIGNRTERGDGKDRKFVENVVCLLLRMIFGVKVPDANAPYRLMKTSIVKKYINKLPKDFNIPNIMFTTYFVHNNESVLFVPITFKPRQGGTNSINPKKIIKIGKKAIGDFMKLRKNLDA